MTVYDFDNTIYDGESPYDFYLFSLKYNPKVVRFVPPLAYYGMRYSKEKCTLEELEHAMAKYLKAYLNSFDDIDGMVSAFWDALIGPMPMTSGLTPVVATDTILARIGAPTSLAFSSLIRITPEDASFMPDALPAVTLPSSWKGGFSFASFSRLASLLGYSSVS